MFYEEMKFKIILSIGTKNYITFILVHLVAHPIRCLQSFDIFSPNFGIKIRGFCVICIFTVTQLPNCKSNAHAAIS